MEDQKNILISKVKCEYCDNFNTKNDDDKKKKCLECNLKNSIEINNIKADFDYLLKVLFDIGVLPTPFLPNKEISFSL
jgi:hypothetical protein